MVADALSAFVRAGRVAVVAAGNTVSGVIAPGQGMLFPATLPTTIAVGAIDRVDALASFSLWGPWPNSPDSVAPGVAVGTTWLDGGYASVSGTSLAAPVLAGCLALGMAANPAAWAVAGDLLDPKYGLALPARTVRARELLRATSLPLGLSQDQAGYGLVSAPGLAQAEAPPSVRPPQASWLPLALGVAGVAVLLAAPAWWRRPQR